jgi:hypothetical protein
LPQVKTNRSNGHALRQNQTIGKTNNTVSRQVTGVPVELTLKERKKLTQLTARKYQKAGKREKTAILNIFVSQTGYERKYVIRLLANGGKTILMRKSVRFAAAQAGGSRRVYEKVYDSAVLDALTAVWKAFNYQCGKLLPPFLRVNIDSIAREPKFAVSDAVRLKLVRISAAAIDRILRKEKAKQRIAAPNRSKGISSPLSPL